MKGWAKIKIIIILKIRVEKEIENEILSLNDIYFGKVLFSSPLLVSLGSQDRNIDHKWRVFQGYDISPKRITVWLTHHISLESPVFYRISIFISIPLS